MEESLKDAALEIFKVGKARGNGIIDKLVVEADSFEDSDDSKKLMAHLAKVVRRIKGLTPNERMYGAFIIGAVFESRCRIVEI